MSNSNRLDLSDWLIHFIHRRNPANDPNEIFGEGDYFSYPFSFRTEERDGEEVEAHHGKTNYSDWDDIFDRDYPIEPDAYAMQVLMKILSDGHIRSGWSFRNCKPTIYGDSPAVCFTEMPLYSLFEYIKSRNKTEYVDSYAICFRKSELFRAGARPVIYGSSTDYEDSADKHPKGEPYFGPRYLENCEIGDRELYRFVSTNLGKGRYVNWTHEREWRWSDPFFKSEFPGFPLFLKEEQFQLSEVIILVKTKDEAKQINKKIKELYDTGFNIYEQSFSMSTLENVYTLSYDEILGSYKQEELEKLRIDDLPKESLGKFIKPDVSKEFKEKVRKAIEQAEKCAINAVNEYVKNAPKDDKGRVGHPFGHGFAWLEIHDGETEFCQALIELGKVDVYSGVEGYRLEDLLTKANTFSQLEIEVIGIEAAKTYLESIFPNCSLYVGKRWD